MKSEFSDEFAHSPRLNLTRMSFDDAKEFPFFDFISSVTMLSDLTPLKSESKLKSRRNLNHQNHWPTQRKFSCNLPSESQ